MIVVRGIGIRRSAYPAIVSVKNYSRVADGLRFVKSVDAQTRLLNEAPVNEKIDLLLLQIGHLKPHMDLLLELFRLCASVGIVSGSTDLRPKRRTPSFLFAYFFKIRPIHNAFWDMCRLTNNLQQSHALHCNPRYLGLLDPVDFPEPIYKKILKGEVVDIK